MSNVAIAPAAASRPAINAWLVAAAVIIPTFMEVLDTTVAIVSLRYIAGELSAAVVDAEWVLTSYLAANATILPISGWLSARLGRRNYFLIVDRSFYHRLRAVRHGHQPVADHPVPDHPGSSRRRTAAVQPGDLDRQFPAREAGNGHDHVRHRGADGASRRADARRVSLRLPQLALDLLTSISRSAASRC